MTKAFFRRTLAGLAPDDERSQPKCCAHCGSQISRRYSAAKLAATRFCSRSCAASARERSAQERFDDSWIGEPNSGCHLWTGAIRTNGYGFLKERGAPVQAHRYSYSRAFGPIPKGLNVLHRCDVPACVNPRHLFLGTQDENVQDRNAKGRTARGSRASRAKITEEMVPAIRQRSSDQAALGKQLGISVSTICAIRARRSWKHVP